MERDGLVELNNIDQNAGIEIKSQNTNEEHKAHSNLLKDRNAEVINDNTVNNLEENKEDNNKSLIRNDEIIESDSSTSTDDENYMLNQKMKLYMVQTSFGKGEKLADGLDFDTNPSYLNDLKNENVDINQHNEEEKLEDVGEERLDTSLVHKLNDNEIIGINNFNNNLDHEMNGDQKMYGENEERLDTSQIDNKDEENLNEENKQNNIQANEINGNENIEEKKEGGLDTSQNDNKKEDNLNEISNNNNIQVIEKGEDVIMSNENEGGLDTSQNDNKDKENLNDISNNNNIQANEINGNENIEEKKEEGLDTSQNDNKKEDNLNEISNNNNIQANEINDNEKIEDKKEGGLDTSSNADKIDVENNDIENPNNSLVIGKNNIVDGNDLNKDDCLDTSSDNKIKQSDKKDIDTKNNELINFFKKKFNNDNNRSRNSELDMEVDDKTSISAFHEKKGIKISNEIDEAADDTILYDAEYSENSIRNKEDFEKIKTNKEMIKRLGYPDSNSEAKNNAKFGTLYEQVEAELRIRGYDKWDPSFITDIVTTINLGSKREDKLEVKLPIRKLFRYSDTEMDTNVSRNLKNQKNEKKSLIYKNKEYKKFKDIMDKEAAINRITICQVIDEKLIHYNYLINSKKNNKETYNDDSSTSVRMNEFNTKDNDYRIILSESENEKNKVKIAAESIKNIREERRKITKELESKALNAFNKKNNKKGKNTSMVIIDDKPSKIPKYIKNRNNLNKGINKLISKKRDQKNLKKKDELRVDHRANMNDQKEEIKRKKDTDSSYNIENDNNIEGSEEFLNEFNEDFSSKTISNENNIEKKIKQKKKSAENSVIVIIDKRNIITTEDSKLDLEEEKLLIDEKVEGMEDEEEDEEEEEEKEEEENKDDDSKQYIKYPSEDSYDGEQGEAIEINVSKKQIEKDAIKIKEVIEHVKKSERRLITNVKNPLMNSDTVYTDTHKKNIKRLIPDTHIELHLRKRQFKRDFIFMKNWHAFINNYTPIRWSDLAIIFLQVQAEHYISSHFARANLLSILSGGSVSPMHLIVLNAIIKEITAFRLSEPIDNAFNELDKGFKVIYTDDEPPTDPELIEKRIKKRKQNQNYKDKRQKNNQDKKVKKDKMKFLKQAKKFGYIVKTKKQKIIEEENINEVELNSQSVDFKKNYMEKANIMDLIKSQNKRKRYSSNSSSATSNITDIQQKGLVKKKTQKQKSIKKNINVDS